MLTATAKVTDFTYDDLNRLLTASTTNATSGGNYYHSYTYNAIGNITASTPAGSYVYGSSTYANPHAATSINGVTYAYDNNGNLTNDVERTHTWDYRNRLSQSIAGPTITYLYDHNNQRVRQMQGMTATITPSPYYSIEDGTPVKYVMGNGMILASIRGTGTSSMPYYLHPDHLGSTEKLTDASGTIAELSDYYPYGATRLNNQYILNDRKGFLGKDFDADTGLNQLDPHVIA